MEFTSSRFQGMPWLWEILNDSDPGTKKLQRVDHSEDVRQVQRALFDLGWTMRVEPSFPDREVFSDSWFGDDTYGVALAFKTHYGIQFSGAGEGEYSGNVGPRTLARLDYQCSLWDASETRILEKAALLDDPEGTMIMGNGPGPNPSNVLGTSGVYWPGTYYGQFGHFCDEESTGTCVVQGRVYDGWVEDGWVTGPLGFPTSDVIDLGDGTQSADFVGGRVTWDSATDTTSVEHWA